MVSRKNTHAWHTIFFVITGKSLIILSLLQSEMNYKRIWNKTATSPQIFCRTTLRNLNVQHIFFTNPLPIEYWYSPDWLDGLWTVHRIFYAQRFLFQFFFWHQRDILWQRLLKMFATALNNKLLTHSLTSACVNDSKHTPVLMTDSMIEQSVIL